MSELIIRQFEHLSEEYWRLVELRRIVLRFPLGMDYTQEQLLNECGGFYFGGWLDHKPVAYASAYRVDKDKIQFKQVAVHPELQGRGFGQELMLTLEGWAQFHGYSRSVLNARKVVEGFYQKLGYVSEEPEFEEVGIPHIRMRKSLTADYADEAF
jgi:GNAT superfamily N-acetyltransferase